LGILSWQLQWTAIHKKKYRLHLQDGSCRGGLHDA